MGRSAILVDDVVKQARSMLWGGWEGNWLAYKVV